MRRAGTATSPYIILVVGLNLLIRTVKQVGMKRKKLWRLDEWNDTSDLTTVSHMVSCGVVWPIMTLGSQSVCLSVDDTSTPWCLGESRLLSTLLWPWVRNHLPVIKALVNQNFEWNSFNEQILEVKATFVQVALSLLHYIGIRII